jgi:hypothetical protein
MSNKKPKRSADTDVLAMALWLKSALWYLVTAATMIANATVWLVIFGQGRHAESFFDQVLAMCVFTSLGAHVIRQHRLDDNYLWYAFFPFSTATLLIDGAWLGALEQFHPWLAVAFVAHAGVFAFVLTCALVIVVRRFRRVPPLARSGATPMHDRVMLQIVSNLRRHSRPSA